jgi:hypothetical protein
MFTLNEMKSDRIKVQKVLNLIGKGKPGLIRKLVKRFNKKDFAEIDKLERRVLKMNKLFIHVPRGE